MSEAKYTPGPWYASEYSSLCDEIVILTNESEYVASIDCDGCYDAPISKQIDANARLIAAAPDLLAALKVARLWLDVDGRFDMQGINAAIAKAEGGDA